MDRPGTSGRRGEGESPAGAEHVEHVEARGQGPQPGPVVALVEEVSGLLPGDHVGLHHQPVLPEQHRSVGCGAQQGGALGPGRAECRADVATGPQHHGGRRHPFGDELGEHRQVGEPGPAVDLGHHHLGVLVEHQPGEPVVLAVHEPVGIGVGRGAQRRPDRQGRIEPLGPEVAVDVAGPPAVEHLDPDRGVGVVEADGDELAVPVEHDSQVPRLRVGALDRGDGGIEHPRVPGPHMALGVRGDPYGQVRHGGHANGLRRRFGPGQVWCTPHGAFTA